MNRFLADHDIEGQAASIWEILRAAGWLDLIDLELLTFADVALPIDSTDRDVWRFAQAHGMILLTNNRNMEDKLSLEESPVQRRHELGRFHRRSGR